jgi:hypothetical protein
MVSQSAVSASANPQELQRLGHQSAPPKRQFLPTTRWRMNCSCYHPENQKLHRFAETSARTPASIGRHTALLIFSFCFLTLSPLHARARSGATAPVVRNVSVTQAKPTQTHVGGRDVREIVREKQRYAAQWANDEHLALKGNQALRAYFERVMQPEYSKRPPVPAVIDPSGEVRVMDGHHRLAALNRIATMAGSDLKIAVAIQKDFRHDPVGYAGFMLKNAYLYPADRKKLDRLSPSQQASALSDVLPASFSELRNDPLRSDVAFALARLKIYSASLQNYAEFKICERLRQKGYKPARGRTNEEAAEGVIRAILDDKALYRHFLSLARGPSSSNERRQNRDALRRQLELFQTEKGGLPLAN